MMIMILIRLFQTLSQTQRQHKCKNTELQETKEKESCQDNKVEGEKNNFNHNPKTRKVT